MNSSKLEVRSVLSENYRKLRDLLQELFQLDQADLDFGIYRIMNQKRDEILRFLDNDLLPHVRRALSQYLAVDREAIESEIAKATTQALALGVDPEQTGKVKILRAQLADSGADLPTLDDDVFSYLTNFFRRYYEQGDFISQRRYRKGVYAIPYEGEEVKLHWANADQYYVKGTEYFRDYTFRLNDGRLVHFEFIAGSTEQNDNLVMDDQERRFVLVNEDPLVEEKGELFIRFEYRIAENGHSQVELSKQAVEAILASQGFGNWISRLGELSPTTSNPARTFLEKHLRQFTARNTFDYFIHTDLGGFLQRELDFFIKNDVMHLDDVEHEAVPKIEQRLALVRTIRQIASKIIGFLAQLENFQKTLWLKKKFVVETNYCITLDQVPEGLYPEIAANDAQREEWLRLFAVDEMTGDLTTPAYSTPLTVDFLKANDKLVLDTRFFDQAFKDRLLASSDDLDSQIEGLVIHSENFQALRLLHARYQREVTCIYADPPYNSDATPILYKNGYRHSSWIALIENRIRLAQRFLDKSGIICITIDDYEGHHLRALFDSALSDFKLLGVVAIKNNPAGRTGTVGFSTNHEYALFYGSPDTSKVNRLEHTEAQKARYKQRDEISPFEWTNFRKHGGLNTYRTRRPRQFYPIYVRVTDIRIPKMTYDKATRQYIVHEPPDPEEEVLLPIDEDGKERIWDFVVSTARDNIKHLLVKPDKSGKTAIYRKWRIHEKGLLPQTWWDKSEYSAPEYGTNLLTNLFGTPHVFTFPKSVHAVADCLKVSGLRDDKDGIVLDFFAGSGTTGHAVLNLNRGDEGSRKYVLVEMARYFDSVLLARLKKAVYASEWKDGKPESRNSGVSHCLKYIRLESYEDTLNNLVLTTTSQQSSVLETQRDFREEYILSYMLQTESRGSPSLLNLEAFRRPEGYQLKIERNGQVELVNVDVAETFNLLLGVAVSRVRMTGGVRVIEGIDPAGDGVVILWRDVDEIDNDSLDRWFEDQGYLDRGTEFQLVYVNGDNNLEGLRRDGQIWKVRLIEDEFRRLMFDIVGA